MNRAYISLFLSFALLLFATVSLACTHSDLHNASTNAVTPTIVVDDGGINIFAADIGKEDIQYYYVDFYNFPKGQSAFIEVNDPNSAFTISTEKLSGYGTRIEIKPNPDGYLDFAIIYVRYKPAEATEHTATVSHSSTGAETKALNLRGFGSNAPMPVDLVSFKTSVRQSAVMLDWKAAPDTELSHFQVEVSRDPKEGFDSVGTISCTEKNKIENTDYSYLYFPRSQGGTHYFRIGQVYADHSISYSRTLSVEVAPIVETSTAVSPNPFKASFNLTVTAAEPGKLQVIVNNMNGREVFSDTYEIMDGENNLKLDIHPNMPSGIYILTAELNDTTNKLKLIKE